MSDGTRRGRSGRTGFQHLVPLRVRQLRPADWPVADRLRWERAQYRDDPLDDDGRLADSQPRTIKTYADAYGSFLAWLASEGELDPSAPLEQRLTPERLGRFIVELRTRCRASTIDARLTFLKIAMQALAPEIDWGWITRHRLAPTTAEVRAARKTVKPVDSIGVVAQGRSMMDKARDRTDRKGSVAFRNGLLLVFQAIFTLRLGNLTEITLGEHLVRRGTRWFLQFQESVKNKADLDYEVPGWLADYLAVYLERFRPVLLCGQPDHGRLWVCDDSFPMKPGGVHAVFDHLSRTTDGQRASTHPFRHAKATAFMLRDPGNLGLAAAALGHNGVSSVNQIYDRSGGIAASRAWNAIKRKRFGRLFDDDDDSAES